MITPAPVRQNVRSLPTPRIEDVIFFESVNVTRIEIPEYGSPHPDSSKWPNHKLGYAECKDQQGLDWIFWYVADRDSQELYDAELTLPYFNNPNFPRFQRTLILPRGTGPGESFEPIPQGTPDIQFPDAVLVSKAVFNIEPPLNSLYQKVVLIFDKIPGGAGDPNGGGGGDPSGQSQVGDGFSWERPIQTSEWIRLTWRLTLPKDVAVNNITEDLEYCIIPGFENLRLVDEPVQASDNGAAVTVIRVYEGLLEGSDSSPSPVVKKKVRDIPGALPPDKFCTVVTTTDDNTLVLDPNNYDVSSVSAPSGTLARVSISPDGGKLRGAADTQYAAFSTTALTGRAWDDNLKTFVDYQVEVMTPADSATYAAAAPGGVEVTVQPYSPYWSIVTTESPAQGTIGGGPPSVKYKITHPYPWPAVLLNLQYGAIGLRPAPGEPPTDGATFFYDYTLKPEWNGLSKSEMEICFSATDPLANVADIPTQYLAPSELSIRWPGVASIAIPPCLHPEQVFIGRTGTDNPRYADVAFSKTWPASQLYTGGSGVDQTDWPDSIIAAFDVTPYRNGFIIKKLTVYKPY